MSSEETIVYIDESIHPGDYKHLIESEFLQSEIYLNQNDYHVMHLMRNTFSLLDVYSFILYSVLLTRLLNLAVDLTITNGTPVKAVISCLLGAVQVSHFMGTLQPEQSITCSRLFLTVVLFQLISIVSLSRHSVDKHHEQRSLTLVAVVTILPVLANEYFIYNLGLSYHTRIRALIMVSSMKTTSLLISNNSRYQSVLTTLSYLIHPVSCCQGIWHAGNYGLEPVDRLTTILRQFVRAARNYFITICIAFVLIILYNYVPLHLESSSDMVKNIAAIYLTALEFRFSSYLNCYHALALFSLWHDPDNMGSILICDPTKIEFPRSLVQVVIHWNTAIHHWLKTNIFNPVKARTNLPTAILATYLTSSLLHGFKFHIWAVLLTLGYLTWLEFKIRQIISFRISACVLANECKYSKDGTCTRAHILMPHNSYGVRIINLMFSLLAMAQLAYLGYIFVGDTDEATYKDALRRWSGVYYFGHVMAVCMHVLLVFIKVPAGFSKKSHLMINK